MKNTTSSDSSTTTTIKENFISWILPLLLTATVVLSSFIIPITAAAWYFKLTAGKIQLDTGSMIGWTVAACIAMISWVVLARDVSKLVKHRMTSISREELNDIYRSGR